MLDGECMAICHIVIVATFCAEQIREVGLRCQMSKDKRFWSLHVLSFFVPRIPACEALGSSSEYIECLYLSILWGFPLLSLDFPNIHLEENCISGAYVCTQCRMTYRFLRVQLFRIGHCQAAHRSISLDIDGLYGSIVSAGTIYVFNLQVQGNGCTRLLSGYFLSFFDTLGTTQQSLIEWLFKGGCHYRVFLYCVESVSVHDVLYL